MTVFEKARELGNMLLTTEESLRMADAQAAFEKAEISEKELIAAVEAFDTMVNQVMAILKATVTGEDPKCSACGHCR